MIESKKRIIRKALRSDENLIVDFLVNHWSRDHILVKHRELLDWQYGNEDDYNFVISINKKSNEIESLLGYIPLSRYDKHKRNELAWGALWKTKENSPFGLGTLLLKFLIESEGLMNYLTLGLSDDSINIYNALEYNVGTLNHYYCASKSVENFSIAKNIICAKNIEETSKIEISFIEDISNISIRNTLVTGKSISYLIGRYKNHPFYQYKFLGVFQKGSLKVIFVIRKQNYLGSSCIRVIDMYGSLDQLPSIQFQLHKLLDKEGAEYIDCYNYGIDPKIMTDLGFKLKSDSEIIPNYFEPFVQKNIDIYFAIDNPQSEYAIFKGDGDQDRPNQINQ